MNRILLRLKLKLSKDEKKGMKKIENQTAIMMLKDIRINHHRNLKRVAIEKEASRLAKKRKVSYVA